VNCNRLRSQPVIVSQQIYLRNRRLSSLDQLMHLRQAEPSDVEFLADVVISVTRDQGRLPGDFDEVDFRTGFESWTAEHLAGTVEGNRTSVIEVDGERAGRLRVVRTGAVVELAGIQLLPPFQSRGIGSEILVLLKAEAASSGASLELSVEIDNPRAQALYERHGLVVTGTTGGERRLRWTSTG